MLKQLGEWVGDLWLYKGDTVSIVSHNAKGEEVIVTEEITKEVHITSGKIYQFEDEFGLKEGYAGVIGNND